jgi:hypothetical protein
MRFLADATHAIARLARVLATCEQLLAGESVIVIVDDARHRACPLPIRRPEGDDVSSD